LHSEARNVTNDEDSADPMRGHRAEFVGSTATDESSEVHVDRSGEQDWTEEDEQRLRGIGGDRAGIETGGGSSGVSGSLDYVLC